MIAGKITSNLPLVRKRYNKFFKKFPRLTKIGLELAGLQLREIILDKTSKGKDTHNRRFPPYSKGYSEAKGKTVVDLYDQGICCRTLLPKLLIKRKFNYFLEAKKKQTKQSGIIMAWANYLSDHFLAIIKRQKLL